MKCQVKMRENSNTKSNCNISFHSHCSYLHLWIAGTTARLLVYFAYRQSFPVFKSCQKKWKNRLTASAWKLYLLLVWTQFHSLACQVGDNKNSHISYFKLPLAGWRGQFFTFSSLYLQNMQSAQPQWSTCQWAHAGWNNIFNTTIYARFGRGIIRHWM